MEASALRKLAAVPTTRGLATRLAVGHLQRQGIKPAPLLSQAGLPSVALGGHQRVSAAAQVELLGLISRVLEDNWIGLTLAADFDLRELGMLYYVTASSQTLGEALQRLQRYVRISNEALAVQVEKGKLCRIRFSYSGVARHVDRHQMELFAFACLRLLRHLVGRKITPEALSFVHSRSGDLREVERLFGCKVAFGAAADEFCFKPALLDLGLVGEDTFLSELMVESCDEALAKRSAVVSPLRIRVENTLKPLLSEGDVRLDMVARRLAIGKRTLARRLAAEGVTFADILSDMRRDLATRYLEERDLPVSKIAWMLGFRGPSSFSHACRRWTGKSPVDYRRARLSELAIAA